MNLQGKTILITGAARRIGRYLAECAAKAGANVVIHHGHSPEQAEEVVAFAKRAGVQAWALQADLEDNQATIKLFERARALATIDAVINSAAIFEPLGWANTTPDEWRRHMEINLTAPFLLSQAFASSLEAGQKGRIINLNDWRALRPAADHLPYTISKAGLAALTRSLAIALAPQVTVNGIAFGAILPPSDGGDPEKAIIDVPAGRWAEMGEVWETVLFLLTGPEYITGEIIHLDGGRHLI